MTTHYDRHLTINRPQGTFIVTIDQNAISIRQHRKRKGVSLAYEEVAAIALAKLRHLHWPDHLKQKPLEQLTHLSHRKIY